MAEHTWTLDVGGISLAMSGPAAWVDLFAEAWSTWSGDADRPRIRFSQDPSLSIPGDPLITARPRFDGVRCLLEVPGFAGQIAPQAEYGLLRAHPAADSGDLAYFVRTAFALRAFEQGALLFHAAGIVHRGAAYALFGRSGSGKTTAARLSTGKPVLSDDLVLLRRAAAGWEVQATPFGRSRMAHARSAPLRALLRLNHAATDSLEPMSTAAAMGELIANSPVVNADPRRAPALLERWEGILQTAPALSLHFRKSATFWEVIDAQLG